MNSRTSANVVISETNNVVTPNTTRPKLPAKGRISCFKGAPLRLTMTATHPPNNPVKTPPPRKMRTGNSLPLSNVLAGRNSLVLFPSIVPRRVIGRSPEPEYISCNRAPSSFSIMRNSMGIDTTPSTSFISSSSTLKSTSFRDHPNVRISQMISGEALAVPTWMLRGANTSPALIAKLPLFQIAKVMAHTLSSSSVDSLLHATPLGLGLRLNASVTSGS